MFPACPVGYLPVQHAVNVAVNVADVVADVVAETSGQVSRHATGVPSCM